MKDETKEELIKENQQLRDQLQNCEDLIQVLSESTNNMVTLHDKDAIYTYYRGPSKYTLKKKDLLGKTPADIFDKVESKKIISGIKNAFKIGSSTQFESVLDWEGEQKIFSEKIYPIFKDDTVVAAAKICNDITEQINIKNSLFESKERYRLVIDATENGVWDWLIEPNEVYFSDQWKAQLGYKPNELKNEFKTWEKLLHPDCKMKMIEKLNNFIKNPTKFFIAEFRLKHKDGSYRWIYNKAVAVVDENEEIARMVGAHLDITERKKADIKITESEEKFSKFFYNHPAPMQIVNIDTGDRIDANKSYLNFSGENINNHLKGDIHKNNNAFDRDRLKELIGKVKKNGGLTEEPFKLITKSGEVISTILSAATLNIKGGDLLIVSYRDITESNRILEKLKISKNHLEKLTNSMTDIVFSVKLPERKIEWVNNSIITLGYKPSECIGKETSFLYPNQDSYIEFGSKLKVALKNKRDFLQTRQELTRKNGEIFIADIITSFIIENDEVNSITSIIRDITTKIEEEKELDKYKNNLEDLIQERTNELEEKNEALDESLKVFVGREQKIKILENKIIELNNSIDT